MLVDAATPNYRKLVLTFIVPYCVATYGVIGARQGNLGLALGGQASTGDVFVGSVHAARTPRAHAPTAQELARHRAFVATLKNPVWNR